MELQLKDYLEKEVYHYQHGLIKRFFCKYINSNTNAVYLLRKSMIYYQSNNKIKRVLSVFYKTKLERRYGCFINPGIKIGIGLRLPHPNGIVIGNNISIGENVAIFQQVTIGGKRPGYYLREGTHPTIGNNVMLLAGCKILGGINVADGTWVGANSVLINDTSTDPNYTYYGIPAKRSQSEHDYFTYD